TTTAARRRRRREATLVSRWVMVATDPPWVVAPLPPTAWARWWDRGVRLASPDPLRWSRPGGVHTSNDHDHRRDQPPAREPVRRVVRPPVPVDPGPAQPRRAGDRGGLGRRRGAGGVGAHGRGPGGPGARRWLRRPGAVVRRPCP